MLPIDALYTGHMPKRPRSQDEESPRDAEVRVVLQEMERQGKLPGLYAMATTEVAILLGRALEILPATDPLRRRIFNALENLVAAKNGLLDESELEALATDLTDVTLAARNTLQ